VMLNSFISDKQGLDEEKRDYEALHSRKEELVILS